MNHHDVIKAYQKVMHLPDTGVLDILFGTAFANRLGGDPLWMFLVAPPACGKSVLVMSISESEHVFSTSTLTPQSLVSGMAGPGGSDPSIIPKLKGKIFAIKDFTTVLTMHHSSRDEIFGILRDAYDGKIEKMFGNGIKRIYDSKFGIIAGVTPAIETVGSTNVTLGERFLYYRFAMSRRSDAGKHEIDMALDSIVSGKGPALLRDVRDAATAVLERHISIHDLPHIDKHFQDRLKTLAAFVARLRTSVSKDKYTGEVHYVPVPEMGTRLVKQLARLTQGICLWRGVKSTLDENARGIWDIIAHTALGSANSRVERLTCSLFLDQHRVGVTLRTLADDTSIPETTCRRVLGDMEVLRICSRDQGGKGNQRWTLLPTVRTRIAYLDLYRAEQAWRQL